MTLYHLSLHSMVLMFCRALAQEDVTSGPGVIAEAAGQAGKQIYSQGDAADSLYAYLTRKAGMYPDIVEQLVANHLEKGDSMSALITSEWYMRPTHFSGWGRPYEFTAGLYKQLGRLEESRDSVSCCCRHLHSSAHSKQNVKLCLCLMMQAML